MDIATVAVTFITAASIWTISGMIYMVASRRHDRRIEDTRRAAGLGKEGSDAME